MGEKKLNLADPGIQIRILKALEDIKPFGPLKHFHMVAIIRTLKQPNAISSTHIWDYLSFEYDMIEFDNQTTDKFLNQSKHFNTIFID